MRYISHHSWVITALLTLVTALGPLSMDMYLPALDVIQKDLHATLGQTQLTLSLYMVILALGQLIMGPLSDRYGRRKILLLGTLLYAIASLACSFVTSIHLLIVARCIQALGVSAGASITSAVVRDIYERRESAKVMGYIGSAMALAPMLAPILGGIVVTYEPWHATFDILMGFGSLIFLGLFFWFAESNHKLNPDALRLKTFLTNYKKILGSKIFLYHTFIATAVFTGMFAFLQMSSTIFITYMHIPKALYGVYFGGSAIGYLIGNQIVSRFVERVGIYYLIKVGSVICLLAGISMVGVSFLPSYSSLLLILPMPFYMMGMGCLLPVTRAGAIDEFHEMAGAAASLTGALRLGVSSIIGALVATQLAGNAHPMTLAMFGAGLATFLLAWGIRINQEPSDSQPQEGDVQVESIP